MDQSWNNDPTESEAIVNALMELEQYQNPYEKRAASMINRFPDGSIKLNRPEDDFTNRTDVARMAHLQNEAREGIVPTEAEMSGYLGVRDQTAKEHAVRQNEKYLQLLARMLQGN